MSKSNTLSAIYIEHTIVLRFLTQYFLQCAHELLHLVDCTIEFGTLNSINCFQFEELNRKLLTFTHGFDLIGGRNFQNILNM